MKEQDRVSYWQLGLRLHATYRIATETLERRGLKSRDMASILSPLGAEGTVQVLALPSGLSVEAGFWRLVWKGTGSPGYLLNLDTKTFRVLSKGLLTPSAQITPTGGPWDAMQGDEVHWAGTLTTRDGVLLIRIQARKVFEFDANTTSLAASLFVPGMGHLVKGYIPTHIEVNAGNTRLGEVEITFELVEADPAMIELPKEFNPEPTEIWTGEGPSAQSQTTGSQTKSDMNDKPKSDSIGEIDPDAVETITPTFLTDIATAVNKLAAAFEEPITSTGLRFAWPWYTQFKAWLENVRDGKVPATTPAERVEAKRWLEDLLPIAIRSWAAVRVDRLFRIDPTLSGWLLPMLTERETPITSINGESPLMVAQRIMANNPPVGNWDTGDFLTLLYKIYVAFAPENPNSIAEGWFIGAPSRTDLGSEITGTIRADLLTALAGDANKKVQRGPSPEDDAIYMNNPLSLPPDIGIDVKLVQFKTEVRIASPLVEASFTTQPGAIALAIRLNEFMMSCAFETSLSPTWWNIGIGLATGGLSWALQTNVGIISLLVPWPRFDFLVTPVLQEFVTWKITLLGVEGLIIPTIITTSAALNVLGDPSFLANLIIGFVRASLQGDIGQGLSNLLEPTLNEFAFPQTMKLVQKLQVKDNKLMDAKLYSVFAGNPPNWQNLPDGMRRFMTTHTDNEVKLEDLPGFASSDVRLSYTTSGYLLGEWIEAIWKELGQVQSIDINWKLEFGISLPTPSPDPPPPEPPGEGPVTETDDTIIIDKGIIGNPAPKPVNWLCLGRPVATLKSVSSPAFDTPLGTVSVPVTLQVGWMHYKLVQNSSRQIISVVTGETDSNGKPVRKRVTRITTWWEVHPSYLESYLVVPGHIETNLYLGLVDWSAPRWPTIQLAFELPLNATFSVDPGASIVRKPPFDILSEDAIKELLKLKVVNSLKLCIQPISKQFFSATHNFDPTSLSRTGFTLLTTRAENPPTMINSTMINPDRPNNLNIGLRLVSDLLGLPLTHGG